MSASEPTPLYYQVKRRLRDRITSGRYPAGAQIPPEGTLEREFGVSRTTVRKAVEELVDEGFLLRRRGVGTFVSDARSRRQESLHKSYLSLGTADIIRLSGQTATRRLLGWEEAPATEEQAALLAHLYAWKGSIQDNDEDLRTAIHWADRLIEPEYQDSVGVYALADNAEEVVQNVMSRNSNEGILEIEINYSDASSWGYFFPGSYFISYPVLRNSGKGDITSVTYGLRRATVLDMYEEGDQRRESFFYALDSTDMNSADLAYLYKWREPRYETSVGWITFTGMDCNRILIRLADIYLLRAECEAKLGMTTQAENDLNAIRGRRGATLYPGGTNDNGGADLQYSIFLERERELLFEGHRYYDAIRNGYYGPHNPHPGVLPEAFDNLTAKEIQDGAIYLPIPETAFNNNDLMLQNIYWQSKMR